MTMFRASKAISRGCSYLTLAAAFALSACGSPVPVPTSYPMTFQQKMQSAAHWQMVAADIWKEVNARLEAGGYHETMIALESPSTSTPFTRALDNFLFTEAVDHSVAVTPNAQFTLTYDVQIIHYGADHDSPAAPLITGIAGAGALAGAAYNHGWSAGSAAAAGVPIAAAADFVDGWVPSDSSTELVLTVSVVDGDSVRIRESKVYYISDDDIDLYQGGKAKSAEKAAADSSLVSSNWYADNPHSVEAMALDEQNQFAIMVDKVNGPIKDINAATSAAAVRCGDMGKSEAKYISQSYPSNDRTRLRVEFQCM